MCAPPYTAQLAGVQTQCMHSVDRTGRGDREYSTCIDSVILTGRGSYIYTALPVTSEAGAGTMD